MVAEVVVVKGAREGCLEREVRETMEVGWNRLE